jgi:ribA/ribD-fused uncharacterized protein
MYGIRFRNREQAFQWHKFLDPKHQAQILLMKTPAEAKARARHLKAFVREDWYQVSISIMQKVVDAFFDQWTDMRAALLATGDEHLEEVNTWGDDFWGTVGGKGRNELGKCLMVTRGRLRPPKSC